jgi:beta-lactamase class A
VPGHRNTNASNFPRRSSTLFCGLILLVLALGPIRGALLSAPGSSSGSTIKWTPGLPPTAPASFETTPTESGIIATPAARTREGLASEIDLLLANEPGVYGVIVLDDQGNRVYARNETVPFIAASLYKLTLMATIYSLIEQGAISLDTPLRLSPAYFTDDDGDGYFGDEDIGTTVSVKQALLATGAWSSNVGARALLSTTSWNAVAAMAAQLGLAHSSFNVELQGKEIASPAPGIADLNEVATAEAFIEGQAVEGAVMLTTPADIAQFFQLLAKGQVVSPSASDGILAILKQQQVNDRIPALLPENVTVAHKTGNLDEVVHDVGLIYIDSGAVTLVLMTENVPDIDVATQTLQTIAHDVYQWAVAA